MSAQLPLFEQPKPNRFSNLPNSFYRAIDEDVLLEAVALFKKQPAGFHSAGRVLVPLADKHNLGGFWTRTIRQLHSLSLVEEMHCYWGSDSPSDKTREYKGFACFYRLKKKALQ